MRGRRARVRARRRGQGDRGRARRQVRRLDLQRPRARADAAGATKATGCGSASSTRAAHPHTIHFHGIHRAGWTACRAWAPATSGRAGDDLRVQRRAVRAAPLPLPLDAAGRPHRKGLYGAFIVDPKEGRPEADEMVMVMNGFDTNFDRANEVYAVNTVAFAYQRPADPGQARRAGADLHREHRSSSTSSTRSTSTRTSSTAIPTGTTLEPTELTDTVIQGQGERGIARAALPVHRQVHVPRPRLRVRGAGLDGLLRGGRLMEARGAQAPAATPCWVAGLAAAAGAGRADRGLRRARCAGPGDATACRSRSWPSSAPRSAGPVRAQACATTGPTRCARAGDRQRPLHDFTQTHDVVSRLGATRSIHPWSRARTTRSTMITATGGDRDTAIEAAAEHAGPPSGLLALMALMASTWASSRWPSGCSGCPDRGGSTRAGSGSCWR